MAFANSPIPFYPEFMMPSKTELDLRGIGLPVCLLKCKSTLIGMNSDDILEVLVPHPDLVLQ